MMAVEISGAGRTEHFVRRRVEHHGVRQESVPAGRRSERKWLGFARTPDMVMATAAMVGSVIVRRSLLVIRRRIQPAEHSRVLRLPLLEIWTARIGFGRNLKATRQQKEMQYSIYAESLPTSTRKSHL